MGWHMRNPADKMIDSSAGFHDCLDSAVAVVITFLPLKCIQIRLCFNTTRKYQEKNHTWDLFYFKLKEIANLRTIFQPSLKTTSWRLNVSFILY